MRTKLILSKFNHTNKRIIYHFWMLIMMSLNVTGDEIKMCLNGSFYVRIKWHLLLFEKLAIRSMNIHWFCQTDRIAALFGCVWRRRIMPIGTICKYQTKAKCIHHEAKQQQQQWNGRKMNTKMTNRIQCERKRVKQMRENGTERESNFSALSVNWHSIRATIK